MHCQVQGLKACRFQARVKLAPPHLEQQRDGAWAMPRVQRRHRQRLAAAAAAAAAVVVDARVVRATRADQVDHDRLAVLERNDVRIERREAMEEESLRALRAVDWAGAPLGPKSDQMVGMHVRQEVGACVRERRKLESQLSAVSRFSLKVV